MYSIGPYEIRQPAVLAPMAGVTDLPFRTVCRELGAGLVTGEMTSSNPRLRDTLKSTLRRASAAESEPRIVQIVGTEPEQMAEAAHYQVEQGAQIVDINMGCPAKKVCKRAAGSALMRDEVLVARILEAVVARCPVPVTLKIRTGWDAANRNAPQVARIAQESGIAALAIHGRTRACRFNGQAEYDTIAEVVQRLSIPVVANGDICSAPQAMEVLKATGAAAVMIGRGALGKPWIFHEINELSGIQNASSELFTGKYLNFGTTKFLERLIIEHLLLIHQHYGAFVSDYTESVGGQMSTAHADLPVKMARKHICWYFEQISNTMGCNNDVDFQPQVVQQHRLIKAARKQFNQLNSCTAQLDYLAELFGDLQTTGDIAA